MLFVVSTGIQSTSNAPQKREYNGQNNGISRCQVRHETSCPGLVNPPWMNQIRAVGSTELAQHQKDMCMLLILKTTILARRHKKNNLQVDHWQGNYMIEIKMIITVQLFQNNLQLGVTYNLLVSRCYMYKVISQATDRLRGRP